MPAPHGLFKSGRKEYEIVADIDRLARDKGAEDIRILAGDQRLNPPSFKQAASIGSHWALYLAVQHERYWAEAGRTFILSGDGKIQAAYERAQEIVAAMAKQLRPNGAVAAIDETARKSWASSTPKPPSMVSPTASVSINGKRRS